jgi:hypothetical protein
MPTPRAARFRKPKLNSNTPNPLLLRNLVWPDFQVEAVGSILKLKRVCERHYPVSDVPDEEA